MHKLNENDLKYVQVTMKRSGCPLKLLLSDTSSQRKVGCARVEKWAGLSRAGQLSPSQTAKPVSQRPQ